VPDPLDAVPFDCPEPADIEVFGAGILGWLDEMEDMEANNLEASRYLVSSAMMVNPTNEYAFPAWGPFGAAEFLSADGAG